MTARRILAICILVLLLCGSIGAALPVSAEEDSVAALKIEGIEENTEEGTITVRVSVEQITAQSGLFGALFKIRYDNSVLELISWENSKPTGWDFSGDDPDAVDFTSIQQAETGKKEKYLDYQLGNAATTNGVKRNGELYTDLHFKVLSDSAESVEITVTNIIFADVALDLFYLPDQRCVIGLHGNEDSPVEPVVSDEPSTPESSVNESEDPAVSQGSDSSENGNGSGELPTDETSADGPGSVESSDVSDPGAEKPSKKVLMWITVEDITNSTGVSGLEFTLKYNADFLQYVSYTCLLPEDWRKDLTEDLTQPGKGSVRFCVQYSDAGHGVKEGGKLGIQVEFTFKGTDFDPGLLTIENQRLVDENGSELSADSYRLATRYEFDGEAISDESFDSNENEGSTLKIVIVVICVAAVLVGAVVTFLVIRKKKLA